MAEANDYIDENYESLMNNMKSNCAGKSWFIVGKCECDESSCAQCLAVDGSVSVMCEDEIEDCFEDGGTYYKITKLAEGKAFFNLMEANEYLSEHSDELDEELSEICSPCEDAMIAMTISWTGDPVAGGRAARVVDGHLELDLMGHWWRNGQRIIECVGVSYNETSYGWSISTGGFSGCIRFGSSYSIMEYAPGEYEEWYMADSFYNIFRNGDWETAMMESFLTIYNGHSYSNQCMESHSCIESSVGCNNGVLWNNMHCIGTNARSLNGSGSVANVFNNGINPQVVCTITMSYTLSGANR